MMANVGRSRSLGAELSASYEWKGLSASASYGYTDARFTRYDDGNNDYSGNHIPYSPEHTFNARAGYCFRINGNAFRGLSISADCSCAGRIWWDEANTLTEPLVVQTGADISLDFKWFDFRFRVDNLLNEDYNVFYFKSVGNIFFQRGKPFRWTAGITIDL
jgi:outer membrane receptor protein involved in Fe transport